MRVNEFLHLVAETARSQVPSNRRGFRTRTRFTLIQIYFVKRTIHYEVWVRGKDRFIEIGLHFESDRETNTALLDYFRQTPRAFEIKDTLGEAVELEQWTESWARVHQLLRYEKLDEATAAAVAKRLGLMIVTLQPMLEHALKRVETGKERA
jgi:hypothetical protein